MASFELHTIRYTIDTSKGSGLSHSIKEGHINPINLCHQPPTHPHSTARESSSLTGTVCIHCYHDLKQFHLRPSLFIPKLKYVLKVQQKTCKQASFPVGKFHTPSPGTHLPKGRFHGIKWLQHWKVKSSPVGKEKSD